METMTSESNISPSSATAVRDLVSHILKKPEEDIKIECKCASLILNCPFPNYNRDEFAICEKINKKFTLEGKSKDALKFAEILRKLQTSNELKNRGSILQFLNCLYGSNNDRQFVVPKDHFPKRLNKSNSKDNMNILESKASEVASMFTTNKDRLLSYATNESHNLLEKALSKKFEELNLVSGCHAQPNLYNLLRDILYAFQGKRGNILQWEPETNNFNVVFKEEFTNPVKRLVLRLVELGWMYCYINQYCIAQSNEISVGLFAQSFVAALKSELVVFDKLINELEAILKKESTLELSYSWSNYLTLHRMLVWTLEPHTQLKILASVVDACKGKKGGALASVLYSHLQHGDTFLHSLIQNILKNVTRPLIKMLSNWIYCGQLEDAFTEFFVAINIAVPDNNLWQEKYSLFKAMIPSFITLEQARKILSTGKAINFLHQVCQDTTFACNEDRRNKALDLMFTESLFSQDKDDNFANILEVNYAQSSKRVLQILQDKYNLMDHLLAMKNYFLLGQEDFIRHLMYLLEADLAKPRKGVYIQNMTRILALAIKATNAKFHNPEVLKRLDVRLLEMSIGDTGWDIFILDYHVDGPIGTVLTASCMESYFRLFFSLWRAKHMEFILSNISYSRTSYRNLLNRVPEITPVVYQCHIILTQMVHFVQQMQHYMVLEVIESCWAGLLLKISSAQNLDQVIAAHENFLGTLLTRALLDEESHLIHKQLKAIYDSIMQFNKIQNMFWKQVRLAVDKLDEMNDMIKENANKQGWEMSNMQKQEFIEPLHKLKKQVISETKEKLKILSCSYEDLVKKFLVMLNDEGNPNLRFLSIRLEQGWYFSGCKP